MLVPGIVSVLAYKGFKWMEDTVIEGNSLIAYNAYVERRTKHMAGARKQQEHDRLWRERAFHQQHLYGYGRRFIDPWIRRRNRRTWMYILFMLLCFATIIGGEINYETRRGDYLQANSDAAETYRTQLQLDIDP